MMRLVNLQSADGSWALDARLAVALGAPLDRLESGLTEVTRGSDRTTESGADRAWATALALAWLAKHAASLEQEWKLLARKGERWLGQAGAAAGDGHAWVEAATEWV